MELFYQIFQLSLLIAVSITMVSLGGMFSERSGVVNIALEGIMIVGAFAGIIFIHLMQSAGSTMNPQLMLTIALVISAIAGAIISTPLSFASINMKADQTIGGTAINTLAPGLVVMLAIALASADIVIFDNAAFFMQEVGVLANIPVIGDLFFKRTYITIYIGIAIWVAVTFILYKTRFGLRIRACGEHPQAADSLGINVYRMRWAGVTLSGVLGGIGGFMLVISTMASFGGNVNGYGFLALAVLIFGQWKPLLVFPAAFFFAFMGSLPAFYSKIPLLANSGLPLEILKMLPYLATLIVLALTSKKSRAPKASGVPYDKGKR